MHSCCCWCNREKTRHDTRNAIFSTRSSTDLLPLEFQVHGSKFYPRGNSVTLTFGGRGSTRNTLPYSPKVEPTIESLKDGQEHAIGSSLCSRLHLRLHRKRYHVHPPLSPAARPVALRQEPLPTTHLPTGLLDFLA